MLFDLATTLMKICVYVDAFNLYYGALKGTRYKWLNLEELCQLQFPGDEIISIQYFTAKLNRRNRPDNSQQVTRQEFYLRALGTISCLEVIEGHYQTNIVAAHLANPTRFGAQVVDVVKSEEKGSDVNIATRMLLDAYDSVFDKAVVITNDSDQRMPIETVITRFKKPVVVLMPLGADGRRPSGVLSKVATSTPIISVASLVNSQFPNELVDHMGRFHKPKEW